MIRLFSALAIVLFIFSGCSKNNGKNNGNDDNDTAQQAYAADLSGSYSPAGGTWAKAIRIQKDGKILVLGQQWFVRLEKDGVTVDNTFKPVNEIASGTQVNAFELQDDGKIIVIDVTADWCLTCKANKRLVLEQDDIVDAMSGPEIVRMQADWTQKDQKIADYLASFGRYGIPFNVVYGPGAPEGIVLPELLTKRAVLDALASAAGE